MTEDDESNASSGSLVANEQIKLTATYLNGIAIATFAVGGLAPIVAVVSDTVQTSAVSRIIALTLVCAAAGGAIHLTAKRHLRGLRE